MIGLFRGSYSCAGARRENRRWLVQLAAGCCVAAFSLMPMMAAQADDITYGYDALGRLTSVTVVGATVFYDYDAAGNITAIRRQGAMSAAAPVNRAGSLLVLDIGDLPVSTASSQASAR
jgi:YD repeat-containing protein